MVRKSKKFLVLAMAAVLAGNEAMLTQASAGGVEPELARSTQNNNPIVTQRYSADPGVMVYNDTVYVYSTNDIYEYEDGQIVENTYKDITTLNCFSSTDMVNWTDHGTIQVAGRDGAASWAKNSWAPCAASKKINGKDKFFLYFADNGGGIGVLTSDSPTGPWVDPIGKGLITRSTPNCSNVEWLFDPAVLVDDDGTGYLYFGGGVPKGKEANPGTARVVKLGADMISLACDPVTIEPPYLFEDSGINKIDGKYYYSYCSNWNTSGSGYSTAAIEYMVSDDPMGPFTYAGEITIQTDVPDLKDVIAKKTDAEFITGVAITNNELTDKNLMALVTKHFNAVTFGNELKPDCLFGYSSTCPKKQTVTLNGTELEVPTMDYSRPEKMLDTILEWNEKHPQDKIRVRGHVLVWHSQTPEWFFHEDYDAAKPYVDKDTMTLRQEWYIKTVLEHFTGKDSKYRDLFYGWDVVNEAVSDARGTYRNGNENSSWWKVYGSNEFIINAFRFANKYAPAELELYYNDYNEWVSSKVSGIVQLLKDVKNAKGTRIDGMGMQGHYQTDGSPSIDEFKKAARAYAESVGKVQITELDMKASNAYDGTDATKEAEYTRQAYRYKQLYEAVLSLRAEGVNMANMTIWGVIDKNSWLQTSNSVGGASDGRRKQCPLLFDDDYQVKPAYWAFVENSDNQTIQVQPVQTIDQNHIPAATEIIIENDTDVNIVFSEKKALLKQALLYKYRGQKLMLMAHLGNGVGYSIDAATIGEQAQDIDLAAALQVISDFTIFIF